MAYGDCSGKTLPSHNRIGCADDAKQLEDCCRTLAITEEVMLSEGSINKNKGNSLYYWFFLQADETPLLACALEEFANLSISDWQGRRADYLAAAWYGGKCYIVVIELRHMLLHIGQTTDKLAQLEQTVRTLITKILPDFLSTEQFGSVCFPQPALADCKIIGIIVPPDRCKRKAERKKILEISGHSVFLTSLPSSMLQNCRITWSDLLHSVIY